MRTKLGANLVTNNLGKLKEAFHKLTLKDVMVGIPDDTANRKDNAELNNATIGYIHEHGAPEMNIPARPFLIPGVKAARNRIVKQMSLAAKRSMKGDATGTEAGLNRVGLVAQNSVRATINEGIAPALAEGTLAARRKRGRTGTKPLIDTGQLRNSITYVLRSK